MGIISRYLKVYLYNEQTFVIECGQMGNLKGYKIKNGYLYQGFKKLGKIKAFETF